MKQVLIVKTGAAGDVLRTTFVLRNLTNDSIVHWLTDPLCIDLINSSLARVYSSVGQIPDIVYDSIYCLEEDVELLKLIGTKVKCKEYTGYYEESGSVFYKGLETDWFDMSLNSKHGIEKANILKLQNKKTFQELIAPIFNITFDQQCYNTLDYNLKDSIVSGDIAIAKSAGNKWPNKNWAYYENLKTVLEDIGYKVNYLPNRPTIKEHIADIASHKLIVSGDSLPMHIATALKKPSVILFTCTSPWEIYDYNLIKKIVTPSIEKYYYTRGSNPEITKEITIDQVLQSIKQHEQFI